MKGQLLNFFANVAGPGSALLCFCLLVDSILYPIERM